MNYHNYLLIILTMALLTLASDTAKADETGDEIARQIRQGNSRELAQNFNTTLQIIVPGNDGRFSRSQAEMIVRDFFSKHTPRSFTISHQGSSSDGSKYYIGVYISGNTTFRTYYLLKQVGEKMLIHQLRFEVED